MRVKVLGPVDAAGQVDVQQRDRKVLAALVVRSPLATDALAAALWGDEPPPSCKNGATNHASCQEVRSLNECRSAYCNLVEMGARLAAGGDSGGPIYWGNTAYGLHEGWKYDPAPPFDRDLFSRADRIDNALDVWIDTN